MPTFLWSGKTGTGQEAVERVTAESAADARKALEARGWSDLHQHTSESHDFVKRDIRASKKPKVHPEFTPQEELAFYQGTAPGFWNRYLKSIRDEFAPILAMGALLAWSIDHRQTSGIIVSGIILGALLLLYPVFHVCFRRTKRLFKKMHSARTWQRWDEVLDCLNKLQDSQRSTNIVIGDSSMVRYRALALAGLGKVDDAVAYFRNAAEKADMPKGLYFGLLANIYAVAKQYDKALACHRQALQEATDKSTACIDLGIYLVRRFNRPEEARPLLAQAETAQLSELARLHLHVVRGMIAFREKDYKAMDKEMLEALAGFQKRALPRPYIFEGSIRTTQGCLAISNAALGNKAAAVRYFAQSEQYLATIGLDDLLTQYRDLIAKC